VIVFLSGFQFDDLFHPLRYWGYQFWSGIGSDIGELSIVISIIVAALAVRRFLHTHFPCHTDGCRKLGFHHVAGTPYRTCWHHHPVLASYERATVPLAQIHEAHSQANLPSSPADGGWRPPSVRS
jgi:hypothetical protein